MYQVATLDFEMHKHHRTEFLPERLAKTERAKLSRLLSEIQLRDQRPFQFMGHIGDTFLENLWLVQLSPHTQEIIY